MKQLKLTKLPWAIKVYKISTFFGASYPSTLQKIFSIGYSNPKACFKCLHTNPYKHAGTHRAPPLNAAGPCVTQTRSLSPGKLLACQSE